MASQAIGASDTVENIDPSAVTTEDGKIRVQVKISPRVRELIDAGRILHDPHAIVTVDKVEVEFDELMATDLESAQALVGDVTDLVMEEKDGAMVPARGKPSVCREFNYGYGLNARRYVRQQYEATAAGPEKKITKGVAALVALGYTVEEATTIAEAKVRAAGE